MRISLLFLAFLTLANTTYAEKNRDEFFNSRRLYYIRIRNWDPKLMGDALKKKQSVPGSIVEVFTTDPKNDKHCPDEAATDDKRLYYTGDFEIGRKGNKTFDLPKGSYKIKLEKYQFFGMPSITLNGMQIDISQMREALAWKMFREMGIPASGHTYAKFCINSTYMGLYSVVEEIDRAYIDRRFENSSEGNLYKANWAEKDLGPATLGLRSDKKYFKNPDKDERTYELKTHEKHKKDKAYNDYSDLRKFIETLHAHDPKSRQFERAMEEVMEVNDFLKWAAVNFLLGAWDNYWSTPSNYAIYNSGTIDKPYFRWLPWDYDNTFGITYGGYDIQNMDPLGWGGLPLIKRVLENDKFRGWYLDHVETVLSRFMNEKWINKEVGAIWPVIERAAMLEADNGTARPHTGRKYTNDQVYWNGREHHLYEEWQGVKIWGILHYAKMRHDKARDQLKKHGR